MSRLVQFGLKQYDQYASDTVHLLQRGLELQGYKLFGRGFPADRDNTDMRAVCETERPEIVFCQASNTWMPGAKQATGEVPDAHFSNYEWLGRQSDIFRVTQYADPRSHQDTHRLWQTEQFRPHAILVRYGLSDILKHNPWLERSRLVRIHHSVTREYVDDVIQPRDGCAILGGCLHRGVYPMRERLHREITSRGDTERFTLRPHHRWAHEGGSAVPDFMQALARHRVCIVCTSAYRWPLKKHYEATAAGCAVITNLPASEQIPVIEENVTRVPSDISLGDLTTLVGRLSREWDLERQRDLSRRTVERYDYRAEAARMAAVLEERRSSGVFKDRRATP